MNLTSTPAPHGVGEFEVAGLTKVPSNVVKPPRVAESPTNLECTLVEIVELRTPDAHDPNTAVFGEVVGVHIADEMFVDGLIDARKLDAIARLGYRPVHTRRRGVLDGTTQLARVIRGREGTWGRSSRFSPTEPLIATGWGRSRLAGG